MYQRPTKDRRIQKTLNLLHEALGALIREKPYDEIVVQEILDRANVGRSTFYMHFRNKDELLVSGIRDMLSSPQSTDLSPSASQVDGILGFSLPVFEHIHRHKSTGKGRMGMRGRAVLHERLRRVLVETVADDLRRPGRERRKMAGQIPAALLAQYVASTFVLVLNWWIESGSPLAPNEVNDLFRGLLLPTLRMSLES